MPRARSRVEPRLTVRAIRPILSGLRALGQDPDALRRAAGVREGDWNDPDARLPMSVGPALLARAAEATGDEHVGLHLAEKADLAAFDVVFYAMSSSPTLGAAYERVCRYQRLINDAATVTLEPEGGFMKLRHRLPDGRPVPKHSAEFIVAAWVRSGREAVGKRWAPREVRFAHPRSSESREPERFFEAPVRFSTGENAILLDEALMAAPCVGANAALLDVMDRHAADRLERAARSSRLADQARAVLAEEMRDGEPTAARLAARLDRSVRTLNRALAEEGTSYREVLDQLRRELAARHLSESRTSITDVAFLLGYSELAAFSRAFKRWTGQSPEEYRRSRGLAQSDKH